MLQEVADNELSINSARANAGKEWENIIALNFPLKHFTLKFKVEKTLKYLKPSLLFSKELELKYYPDSNDATHN